MGIFYSNITLVGPSQDEVCEVLSRTGRTAFVSPTVRRFTLVYDQETDGRDAVGLCQLASQLSRQFVCLAFAVQIVDGDTFQYWLYRAGDLVDEYDSTPGYLDATRSGMLPPSGGDAQKLSDAFDVGASIRRVERIFQLAENSNDLEDPAKECLIGEDIHRELTRVLDMPLFAVETGYHTIANGYLPAEFDRARFRKC